MPLIWRYTSVTVVCGQSTNDVFSAVPAHLNEPHPSCPWSTFGDIPCDLFHSSQGHFRLLLILYRANNFFLSTFANLSPLFFFPSIYSKVKGFSKLKSKLTWNSYFICQTSIKANPIKTFHIFP